MIKNTVIILLAIFLSGLSAQAYTPQPRIDCVRPADHYEINECAIREKDPFENELNQGYHEVKARLKNNQQAEEAFTKAQRAWLTFLEEECHFQSGTLDNTKAQAYQQCRSNLIKKRLAEFHYYLTCQQGDIRCPSWQNDNLLQNNQLISQ